MHTQLSHLLETLETELKSAEYWETSAPPAAALASQQPFAADCLRFDQWLQWLMLPKFRHLVALRLPLPTSCSILPMAEMAYAERPNCAQILAVIGAIDELLAAPASHR